MSTIMVNVSFFVVGMSVWPENTLTVDGTQHSSSSSSSSKVN